MLYFQNKFKCFMSVLLNTRSKGKHEATSASAFTVSSVQNRIQKTALVLLVLGQVFLSRAMEKTMRSSPPLLPHTHTFSQGVKIPSASWM